ncbi:conserved hypothetical protein [Neospora caninum Liverpool]|uniref:Bucentaur or craniofacial development domain-containing protein n=1 Tax=Neospora caninum (strain Liverpool) TaxID=572307 RepID=F0VBI8_NEOCL|nr:conserved hypothetical protein [Neospora caninum Liverpool]CBZ50972.1 conserved hypothetical protein [Neospora caninum Liverpool]CEL68275.1 TPA: bucentaur or craniofacial development domain-containing protein [Neospora caninum Liverpool]|eukprot:XP_003881005.1 conserved hypothetical protein [Neospora caninum Liverpool]
MASLLDMKFGSDSEEDDEDYAGSAGSSEESGEDASDEEQDSTRAEGSCTHGDSSHPSQAPASTAWPEATRPAGTCIPDGGDGGDGDEMTVARRKPVIASSRRKRMLRGKQREDEKRKSKAAKKAEEEARKQETAALFAEMEKESREALSSYNSPTPTDDFLLQFHRRCPSTGEKRNQTWQQLQHHLSIAVSALQPTSQLRGGSAPLSGVVPKTQSTGQHAVSRGPLGPSDAESAGASAALGAQKAVDPEGRGGDGKPENLHDGTLATLSGTTATATTFSVREFKQRCRRPTDAAVIKLRDEAMRSLDTTGEVIVKKVARFAGQNIEVEARMEAASEEYQKFLQMQQKAQQLGGQFAELDGLVAGNPTVYRCSHETLAAWTSCVDAAGTVAALDGPSAINSVEKSQADWEKFKRDKGIEAELKKGHGYLDKQSFLAETEWRQHEKNVELRRRQQLQQQAQQPQSSRT